MLSRWLSDREVAALVGWIGRACDERVARYRDLIARVVAGLGEADRDEHGNYVVIVGWTLARHLFDSISPEERGE